MLIGRGSVLQVIVVPLKLALPCYLCYYVCVVSRISLHDMLNKACTVAAKQQPCASSKERPTALDGNGSCTLSPCSSLTLEMSSTFLLQNICAMLIDCAFTLFATDCTFVTTIQTWLFFLLSQICPLFVLSHSECCWQSCRFLILTCSRTAHCRQPGQQQKPTGHNSQWPHEK